MLNNKWFTETCEEYSTAFSIKVNAKLHQETTPWQLIEIYDSVQFGKVMVIDGFCMLTTKDNFIYHEMLAHCSLFAHKNPQDVLIVGGGDCGTLLEVCKHPIKRVVQVEIDQRVTELSQQYFPELCTANNDPRASLVFEDAISWVKRAPTSSFDVIIIDSTDPIGPGEGLFSAAFYADCKRILRPGGIAIHQSESPFANYRLLKSIRRKMQATEFADIKTVFFPMPTYPSGWWSATLACTSTELVEPRDNNLSGLKYYSKEMHQAAMVRPNFLGNL